LESLKSSFIWEIRTVAFAGKNTFLVWPSNRK
jgi:hypothetical protein